ncbi:hypothetical protein RUM43_008855 [Polyplax serrata]|uniref:Uncharacterized protein n=1 Tax=Polyplax serrata TaxID=468196 RepID=A0AAN8PGX0_POLSC
MKLNYNNETRTTSNTEGVITEIPGFGNSSVVEWIDPSKASPGAYYRYLADVLVEQGYVRDISIRGAPYDFRKGPNENQEFISNLINLVEETYTLNGNKSVVLIAHSMGGPMTHLLLKKVTQAWKDKYVRALVGLNGAWGGSVKALKVYVVGDNLGAFMLKEGVVREMQISAPSLAWLMPSKQLWKENEVLVETDKKNYTVNDFEDFFRDINYEIGWEMYKDVLPFKDHLTAPGVEVHCLHGYGVDTTEKLFYKPREFPSAYPTLVKGAGDGTVNERSLEACLHWKNLQKQKVYHQPFPKVDHMNILRNQNVLNYISQLLNKL